jgi:hypothetical protein
MGADASSRRFAALQVGKSSYAEACAGEEHFRYWRRAEGNLEDGFSRRLPVVRRRMTTQLSSAVTGASKFSCAVVDAIRRPRYSRSTEFGQSLHFAVAPCSPSSGYDSALRATAPSKISHFSVCARACCTLDRCRVCFGFAGRRRRSTIRREDGALLGPAGLYKQDLPQEPAVKICRQKLPSIFAVKIYRQYSPSEFTVREDIEPFEDSAGNYT